MPLIMFLAFPLPQSEAIGLAANMSSVRCHHPQQAELIFENTVLVHERDAQSHSISSHPELAVSQQLLFLNGDIHFGALANRDVILLEKNEIEIKKIDHIQYGNNLLIDKAEAEYKLSSKDPATLISYEAKQSIVVCNDSKPISNEILIELPNDPYNAYWLVSKEKRKKVFYQDKNIIINQCAAPEIATIPSPEHYWYSWNPHASTYCEQILSTGNTIRSIKAEIKKTKQIMSMDALTKIKKEKNISFSILFGFVSEADIDQTLRDTKKFFKKHLSEVAKVKNNAIDLSKFNAEKEDAALWASLDFISHLHQVMSLSEISFDANDHFTLFHIEGILRNSQQKIQLKIYLGPSAISDSHFRANLTGSLTDSKVVFFIGHAGAGSDINWSSLLNPSQRQPQQVVGIISCYASSFFNHSYAEYREMNKLDTNLFLANFSAYRYLVPLSVLEYFDRANTSIGTADFEELMTKYLDKNETLLLQ